MAKSTATIREDHPEWGVVITCGRCGREQLDGNQRLCKNCYHDFGCHQFAHRFDAEGNFHENPPHWSDGRELCTLREWEHKEGNDG